MLQTPLRPTGPALSSVRKTVRNLRAPPAPPDQELEIKFAEFECICSAQTKHGADLCLWFVTGCRLIVTSVLWKVLGLCFRHDASISPSFNCLFLRQYFFRPQSRSSQSVFVHILC